MTNFHSLLFYVFGIQIWIQRCLLIFFLCYVLHLALFQITLCPVSVFQGLLLKCNFTVASGHYRVCALTTYPLLYNFWNAEIHSLYNFDIFVWWTSLSMSLLWMAKYAILYLSSKHRRCPNAKVHQGPCCLSTAITILIRPTWINGLILWSLECPNLLMSRQPAHFWFDKTFPSLPYKIP